MSDIIICLLLMMFLEFAEDSKYELIFLRSKYDPQVLTSVIANEKFKLSILNITWKVPRIQLADAFKLEIFKTIISRQPPSAVL